MNENELYKYFTWIFETEIDLKSLSKQQAMKVMKYFQQFILRILRKLKELMPFDDIVLSNIHGFDPLESNRKNWIEIRDRFPNIVENHELPDFCDHLSNWMGDIKNLQEKRKQYIEQRKLPDGTIIEEFNVVNFYNDSQIKAAYPKLVRLAKAILILPHSGAAIARAFSQLKSICYDKRNKLSNETLESLFMIKVNYSDFDEALIVNQLVKNYE